MSRAIWVLLPLLVVSCVTPAPGTSASSPSSALSAVPIGVSPSPTATPPPTPTRDEIAVQILQLLSVRDEAQRTGDEQALLAVLDQNAAPELRDRELALLRMTNARRGTPPKRTLVRRAPLSAARDDIQVVEVVEDDDQGRSRRMRYFANIACCTRLTEPTPAQADELLGPLRSRPSEGFVIRYRDIDADQAAATETIAKSALADLVAALGPAYATHRPFTITLAPTTIAGLPAPASGYVDGTEVTLLSSQSTVVTTGPGAEWAKRVVTHEIAHVLLYGRGAGPWVLAEGLPLWLTDDRRQPELDRLVAAKALWDLPHLMEGPRDLSEFFAGYAQASSFTRYLAARFGAKAVVAAWESARSQPTFEEAFRSGIGVTYADAWADWKRSLGA